MNKAIITHPYQVWAFTRSRGGFWRRWDFQFYQSAKAFLDSMVLDQQTCRPKIISVGLKADHQTRFLTLIYDGAPCSRQWNHAESNTAFQGAVENQPGSLCGTEAPIPGSRYCL